LRNLPLDSIQRILELLELGDSCLLMYKVLYLYNLLLDTLHNRLELLHIGLALHVLEILLEALHIALKPSESLFNF